MLFIVQSNYQFSMYHTIDFKWNSQSSLQICPIKLNKWALSLEFQKKKSYLGKGQKELYRNFQTFIKNKNKKPRAGENARSLKVFRPFFTIFGVKRGIKFFKKIRNSKKMENFNFSKASRMLCTKFFAQEKKTVTGSFRTYIQKTETGETRSKPKFLAGLGTD